MEQEAEIKKYIEQDYNHHIDLITGLSLKQLELIHFDGKGLVVYHQRANIYIITHDEDIDGIKYINLIPDKLNDALVLIHQSSDIPYIEEKYHDQYQIRLDCYQAVYRLKDKISLPKNDLKIKELTELDIPFVVEHYHKSMSEEDIKSKIEHQEMWGAFLNEECIGFIGLHEEGSFGLLEILPKHQGKGYATILEGTVINLLLEQDRIPFAQIEPDNVVSMALHKKLGFEQADKLIHWFF